MAIGALAKRAYENEGVATILLTARLYLATAGMQHKFRVTVR